jgi:hypothetical protein
MGQTGPPGNAGWYPNPADPLLTHYWDGTVWTETRRWTGSEWQVVAPVAVAPVGARTAAVAPAGAYAAAITRFAVPNTGNSSAPYVQPQLRNIGAVLLPVGTVVARQQAKDGSVRNVTFFNDTELAPGEETQLISQLFNAVELRFLKYEFKGGAIPLSGVATRRRLGWSFRP